MARDVWLIRRIGWEAFVKLRTGRGDLTDMTKVKHPARRLLRHYHHHGVPVKLKSSPWTSAQNQAALKRGPHKSATEYQDFLRTEFAEMITLGHWTVLPYKIAKKFFGLRISPLGVVPQNERRPRTIVDYTFYDLNKESVPTAPTEAMQFGRTLDRLIRHVVTACPSNGQVHLIKVDLSDGFYRLSLNAKDAPQLAVAFPNPTLEGDDTDLDPIPLDDMLVAIPLRAPMGWTWSPPYFCAATETVADIANNNIKKWRNPPPHRLDLVADSPPSADNLPPLVPSRDLPPALDTPIDRDPALAVKNRRILAEVDVFVDDFLGVAQGNLKRLRRVRRILLHAIDTVFRPLDADETVKRNETASVKKLRKGDAAWSTCKKVLGWIINTSTMTLHLPPNRMERLATILASLPRTQRRTSTKKWHQTLGELRSMTLAIPGARGLFSHLQLALRDRPAEHRIRLSKGVHDAMDDFRLLHQDLRRRPTCLYELVLLTPTLVGAHDASGHGAGGVWLPADHAIPRTQQQTHPIVWRMSFPKHVQQKLSSFKNPTGEITNSDLELAGSVLQHEAATQTFDIRERTIYSRSDNTPTVFWQRKGSTTTAGPAAYLLRMQALHQRHHRYVPRHDYLEGVNNKAADDASRLTHLSDDEFLTHFNSTYPQKATWKLWTPTPNIISSVISALHRQRCNPASLLNAPPPPMVTGTRGPNSAPSWPSTPYSQIGPTLSLSYKSSSNGIAPEKLLQAADRSALARPKMPYGVLAKRSAAWGPTTRG